VWCANVGDSWCVLFKKDKKIVPLSTDHKPDLKAEKDRILSKGGWVESYKDINGNSLGPARVWLKDEDIPGLAMSRSFGDLIACSIGVICDPGNQICINDQKFLILY
jgi:serine/threonine protein phosphatase PrpC